MLFVLNIIYIDISYIYRYKYILILCDDRSFQTCFVASWLLCPFWGEQAEHRTLICCSQARELPNPNSSPLFQHFLQHFETTSCSRHFTAALKIQKIFKQFGSPFVWRSNIGHTLISWPILWAFFTRFWLILGWTNPNFRGRRKSCRHSESLEELEEFSSGGRGQEHGLQCGKQIGPKSSGWMGHRMFVPKIHWEKKSHLVCPIIFWMNYSLTLKIAEIWRSVLWHDSPNSSPATSKWGHHICSRILW